jgi:hypothetical protein
MPLTIEAFKANVDLIYCPVTRQILRHPVDIGGYFFELAAILQILKGNGLHPLNPTLRITTLIYAHTLKSALEESYGDHEDRYPNYDKNIALDEAKQLLAASAEFSGNYFFINGL